MSKLAAVILTGAICLPLGSLLSSSASADRRRNSLPDDVAVRHRRLLLRNGDTPLLGQRHMDRAQNALHVALDELEASKRDNEILWSDTTGRVTSMRQAVEQTVQLVDKTAAWVDDGTVANAQLVP